MAYLFEDLKKTHFYVAKVYTYISMSYFKCLRKLHEIGTPGDEGAIFSTLICKTIGQTAFVSNDGRSQEQVLIGLC